MRDYVTSEHDGTAYRPTVSVVIPVYNGERSVAELVARLESVLNSIADSFELILVNDGSLDHSWDVIAALANERQWVTGIDLMRNYGQHNALLCGIRLARYDITVTLDDDLQHPPELIPQLIGEMAKGFDVVYGSPKDEQHGFCRDVASQITKLALQSAMGSEVARSVSAFRVFRTEVREAFADYQNPFVSIDVLLTWGTTRFGVLRVCHEPRKLGETNYTFRKLVTHALNMMTGFSTLPLQVASMVGFVFTLFGLVVLAFVLGRYLLQGSVVAGFAFLASAMAIFAGAQLFALGVIGEYLARMHFRMMDRPTYVVRSCDLHQRWR